MKKHFVIVCILAAIILSGCSTIAPKINKQKQASLDEVADGTGNHQNSGILGFTTNGDILITPSKRDEYNSLVSKFGSRLTPPVTKPDYGLTPYTNDIVESLFSSGTKQMPAFKRTTELWRMNPKAIENFITLNTYSTTPQPLKKNQ